MKLTLSADWKRENDVLFGYERELRIAGLFASVEFRGDVYEWRVREDSVVSVLDIGSGWVDSFEAAEEASEKAIRAFFQREGSLI